MRNMEKTPTVISHQQDSDVNGPSDLGNRLGSFTRRALVSVGLVVAAVALLAFLWYAVDVLLLLFAAILLAVFLRGLSDWVSHRTPLREGWALVVVIVALLCITVAGAWLIAPDVAEQADQLSQSMPRAVERIQERVGRYEWGRRILVRLPSTEDLMPDRADVLARVTGVFSTTLGALANFVIILFVGLYLAVSPGLYTRGLVRLFPAAERNRAREVLNAVGAALRGWLLGKLITMFIVGILTITGLWLLGVPLALTLGLIAFFLAFIPNVGPILSVIPALAIALMQSPEMALYVLLLYLGVQVVESYLLNPLVYKRTVELPPALTLASQVLLGVLFGGVGVALATPLTAAALVLTKMLYVEDALGDRASAS